VVADPAHQYKVLEGRPRDEHVVRPTETAEQAQKLAWFILLNVDIALNAGIKVVEDERDVLFGLLRVLKGPCGNSTRGPLAPPRADRAPTSASARGRRGAVPSLHAGLRVCCKQAPRLVAEAERAFLGSGLRNCI
jgi:hypothetical protein